MTGSMQTAFSIWAGALVCVASFFYDNDIDLREQRYCVASVSWANTTMHVEQHDNIVKKLSTLDRFLPVWIFLAMALGLILGKAWPGLGATLDRVKVDNVSLNWPSRSRWVSSASHPVKRWLVSSGRSSKYRRSSL